MHTQEIVVTRRRVEESKEEEWETRRTRGWRSKARTFVTHEKPTRQYRKPVSSSDRRSKKQPGRGRVPSTGRMGDRGRAASEYDPRSQHAWWPTPPTSVDPCSSPPTGSVEPPSLSIVHAAWTVGQGGRARVSAVHGCDGSRGGGGRCDVVEWRGNRAQRAVYAS